MVAARDFVNGDDTVTDESAQPVTGEETRSSQNLHGAQVMSVVVGRDADRFLGVAPGARLLLAKTEDNGAEMPVEEDRWVAGLEWADSLGARIASTSLGVSTTQSRPSSRFGFAHSGQTSRSLRVRHRRQWPMRSMASASTAANRRPPSRSRLESPSCPQPRPQARPPATP